MSATQCVAGVFWGACILNAYTEYGWPGVILIALAGIAGAWAIIRFNPLKKRTPHDA